MQQLFFQKFFAFSGACAIIFICITHESQGGSRTMAEVKDGYELFCKIQSELEEKGAFVVDEKPYDGYELFCKIQNELEEKGAFVVE